VDAATSQRAASAALRGESEERAGHFCSGACAHLESWDYKPELIRRHGEPMPGTDKLITFQGENGT
jgi:hypothetical protein